MPRESPPVTNHDLMTVTQVADLLQVAPRTLYNWRSAGKGPPGFRVGGQLRYRRSDVETWLDAQAKEGRLRP